MFDDIENSVIEFDDFITKSYADAIEGKISVVDDFPWYYKEDVTRPSGCDKNDDEISNPGFSHGVFSTETGVVSPKIHPLVLPLYFRIEEKTGLKLKELFRFRLGLCSRGASGDRLYHKPHVDRWDDHWTALYYVNDADGDTFVFNETNPKGDLCLNDEYVFANNWTIKKRITPKKGKLALFHGKHYHARSRQKVSGGRIVLTINFSTER